MSRAKGITRRAFGILAATIPFVVATRRLSAQSSGLPECSRDITDGGFEIGASRLDDGSEVYAVSLPDSRIRANNALGYVDVGPFHYYHRVDASGPEEGLSLWFNTDDEGQVPIFAADETGFYEIYAAGQRVLSETLRSNESSRSLPNTGGVIHRMLSGDSTVRVTLGDAYYDWKISASQLARAVARAQGLLYQVQQDYARGACQPASAEPCLLTTVACREIGLADDCAELKAVRRLRDGLLVKQPFGPAALAWYRTNSRAILDAVSARDRRRLFTRFYMVRLVPAVIAEKLGFHRWAFVWLRRGVEALHARYVLAPRVSAATTRPKTP